MAREDGPICDGDVISIARAARGLSMRKTVAAEWMRRSGLVRLIAGRERVIWGDVLAAVREAPDPDRARRRQSERRASLAHLPRVAL
jgi:hypothetical protein